jgi:hypothetical protein
MVANLCLFLGKRQQSYCKQNQRNASMVLALGQIQREEVLKNLMFCGNRVKWVEP